MTSDTGADKLGQTFTDYLGVLWRHKWVILVVVVVATAGGYALSAVQAKHYRAETQLIWEGSVDVANPLSGSSGYTDAASRTVDLQSVGTVLSSPEMTQRAEKRMADEAGAQVLEGEYEVSAEVVANQSLAAGQTDVYASVATVVGDSTDPELAALAANAYATEFISWRAERQKERISSAIEVVQDQLDAMDSRSAQLSSDYIILQQRLHDLQISRASADGNFRVIVPATVPDAPYAPQPFKTALMAFGVGLIVAIALAFLVDQFDTRLRDDSEVATLLRQPILGRIPRINGHSLAQSALVAQTDPDGHPAEAFRMVRTNLDFMNVDGEVRTLLVTSCLQGEGKSVFVANLAVTLALAGKKVIIMDADLRRPRLHQYFGLSNERGLSTVGTGQSELDDALQAVPATVTDVPAEPMRFRDWAGGDEAHGRLWVLTSGPIPPNPGEIVASKRLAGITETLAHDADIVLLDSPAMLAVGDTQALADKVDALVFLVDGNVIRRQQLEQAREQLDRLPCRILGVVVARRKSSGSRYGYYYSSYSEAQPGQRRSKRRASAPV